MAGAKLMKIFVDTAAWCALYDRNDTYHPEATSFLKELVGRELRLVTSDYVIDETLTLLRFRAGHREVVRFGGWILQSDLVIVVEVAAEVRHRAWDIFVKYVDKDLSFTDCTSVAIMQERGMTNAFTFDDHFRQLGFVMSP